MALNIVTSTQPLNVENIITLIYGDPGIWKTSLAFTAKRPILFDFDKGAYRAANRKDSVQIEAWHEVARITPQDLANYDTIIIDTAGRALDMITDSLKRDTRNTRKDGQLSMQGYGKLGGIFTDWLKMLRGMGKDIVLLAHTSEDKDGDNIIKRPDMVGGSKREAYKIADMMAYMTTQHGEDGDIKTLNFVPHPAYLAKDSGQIGNVTVISVADAPNQLADIIQATKDHINSFSAEAAKAHQDLSALRSELMDIDSAEKFNKLIAALDSNHLLHDQMRRDIWSAAQSISTIEFDKPNKRFVDISDDFEPMDEQAGELEQFSPTLEPG